MDKTTWKPGSGVLPQPSLQSFFLTKPPAAPSFPPHTVFDLSPLHTLIILRKVEYDAIALGDEDALGPLSGGHKPNLSKIVDTHLS
jgi:hypothetical protein